MLTLAYGVESSRKSLHEVVEVLNGAENLCFVLVESICYFHVSGYFALYVSQQLESLTLPKLALFRLSL